MSIFYEHFERHEGGEGLKARSTHYCPGCGHGLVHRYLAEAVEALGVQNRTVAISPVGCAVFLHYYLDVGHVQAPHGRAPAVALGLKLAHPDSVVISYQGDGDLASIGLAEIIQVAQMGLPITVIFVNNAVFGMTGGQMAPTSLAGQRTATTPGGRGRPMGDPLRVAELVAGLDGPVYVERVALYDAVRRARAQKAIRKAIALQVENRGFALVEVLSECPLYLGLSPLEAEGWVEEHMTPVFPLGVKKDLGSAREAWPSWPAPCFDAEAVAAIVGGAGTPVTRFARAFPRRWGGEVGLKLAGAGGDGAQTAAMIVTKAAIDEGFDATHIPSYGPQSRGGTSYADVRLAEVDVLSPGVPHPHVLVAFNSPSLAKFGPEVVPGGIVVYDSSATPDPPALDPRIRLVPVPMTDIAHALGHAAVKNIVALGALTAAADLLPAESILTAMRLRLGDKAALLEVDMRAFAAGLNAVTG